jgi:hypothetical protein
LRKDAGEEGNMKNKVVVVKQDEEQPIPVEILAKAVVELDKSAKRIASAD